MPSILQDSKIVNIAAARSPPASEPRKTKFLRVIARGLIARSAALLVISNRPSVVYRVSADHREVAYRMALASVPAPLIWLRTLSMKLLIRTPPARRPTAPPVLA